MRAHFCFYRKKNMRGALSNRGNLSGFTLIELMVSISILAIMGGLVSQLMSSTSRLTSNSKQSSECDTEARYALTQLSADIARRVRRPDVDALVKKGPGNDQFFLFSETAGYAPNLTDSSNPNKSSNRSPISLVGYRVQTVKKGGLTLLELQRYARALPWTNAGEDRALPFVVLSGSPPVPLPSSTLGGSRGDGTDGSFPKAVNADPDDIYFQPIAQNVVRFEISVLKKADMSVPTDPKPARLLTDTEIPTELSQNGLSNIASIVFSIAVLDAQSAAKAKQQDIDSLDLDDSTPGDFPLYPADKWNEKFKSKVASLPRYLAGGLHFYQRVISL